MLSNLKINIIFLLILFNYKYHNFYINLLSISFYLYEFLMAYSTVNIVNDMYKKNKNIILLGATELFLKYYFFNFLYFRYIESILYYSS